MAGMDRNPRLNMLSGNNAEFLGEARWYACRTRARAEKQVDRLLVGAGFETYLPLVDRHRKWADRTKRVAFPLFPGYTFARFSMGCFIDVVRTPGLVEVVGGADCPTPVRDEELEAVRRLTRGTQFTGTPPRLENDGWEPGTPVRVTEGPFRGMRGRLVEVRGATRLVVRLTAIRMAASVELKPGMVRQVG